MRIDSDLLEKVRQFAERRHTTLTALVEQYFVDLLESEKPVIVEADQI